MGVLTMKYAYGMPTQPSVLVPVTSVRTRLYMIGINISVYILDS